ncbi:MAG: RNA polymerase sigma factor [Anaerolineae bacterium]|jgi:RNA polymerase sigma-70 factor, ECF subfamily|nr:RNA polymerase sigma factor [Anaerolineae bacterium]MBT7075863.1 RNA polymerase sigma factor [Anaerolineae bacterium]MBT7781608.1 RNA polymerase sigma factor [Anaerolineae bacterium]
MQNQRDNETWLKDLSAEGTQKEAAVEDLHQILLRILPAALSRWLPDSSSHFETFIEDTAQETLLRVLDKLDTFQGRSKFTTWVYKIGVNIGLGELRLKKWKETSLDKLEEGKEADEMPSERFAAEDPSPETQLERKNVISMVQRIMKEELTPRQYKVMMAVAVEGKPLNLVAEEVGSNRNALYKLMHDARLRLKQRLEREGASPIELLAVFK